jgi:hypothetical protein
VTGLELGDLRDDSDCSERFLHLLARESDSLVIPEAAFLSRCNPLFRRDLLKYDDNHDLNLHLLLLLVQHDRATKW